VLVKDSDDILANAAVRVGRAICSRGHLFPMQQVAEPPGSDR